MTAQIAIANRKGIALASDSASTADGKKIFTSSQKIFRLSLHHPVAIMKNNVADINYIPLEAIIKVYRKRLGDKSFPYVEDYLVDFLNFLDNGNPIFTSDIQKMEIRFRFKNVINIIKYRIVKKIKANNETVNIKTTDKYKDEVINELLAEWEKEEYMDRMNHEFTMYFLEKYKDTLDYSFNENKTEFTFNSEQSEKVKQIMAYLFSKKAITDVNFTEVVVAGFGEEEVFPSISFACIQGVVADRIKFKMYKSKSVKVDSTTLIIPFAQSDMIKLFMNGVHPDYKKYLISYTNVLEKKFKEFIIDQNLLGEIKPEIKNNLIKEFESFSSSKFKDFIYDLSIYEQKKHSELIVNTVKYLPKNELSKMAESLVSLTSLKRRVSSDSETVGGSTHVAYISKGDGFEWIKKMDQ